MRLSRTAASFDRRTASPPLDLSPALLSLDINTVPQTDQGRDRLN